jgi:ketosteroid isomerase-like protein
MGDANVEVVTAAYDAFARGDLPAVLEMFTDD